jgi:NAD(P)-dependent dehydrogenase (short-subunit alcohol dehydrogenase family)
MTPVILVTGSSRGLGRGIAQHLAGCGYSVAINYANNAEAADETLELCEAGRQTDAQQFLTVQADVAHSADRDRMLADVLAHFGRLDCLVNNAGVAPLTRDDIVDAGEESYDRVMETNLKGPYFLTQAVARYWLEEEPEPVLSCGFCIVFVTSVSANTASPSRGEYCISKAGLSMAAQLWAVRLAADGIPVYELRPGIMTSDMTDGVREKYDKPILEGALVPQRRWGTAEDVGRAVTSLVDGDFPFSTGTIIDIDGGLQIRQF